MARFLNALLLVGSLTALLALPATSAAQAPPSVTVDLTSVGGSTAAGTALLAAEGDATNLDVQLTGLEPGSTYSVRMHAGTCDQPSASAAALPDLAASAGGSGAASGPLLFQGSEPIALETIADGEHVLIVSTDAAVACGTIGPLPALPVVPPDTGSAGLAAPGTEGSPFVATGLLALAAAFVAAARVQVGKRQDRIAPTGRRNGPRAI